jgi:hypothetical protein
MRKAKIIYISGRLWLDKVNGNTYYSVKVWVDREVALVVGLTYGYEDCYLSKTIATLKGLYNLSDAKIYHEKAYGPKREMYK